MIACPEFLRRFPNRRWLFVFVACLMAQVLVITLVFQIELANLIEFDKKLRRHKQYRPGELNGQRPNQLESNKKSDEVHLGESVCCNESDNESDDKISTCDTNDPYLLSAIERAKTSFCRSTIRRVFCLHQTNQLYPIKPVNRSSCPINGFFKQVGCFLNNRRPSIIESLVYQYKKANELKCSYLCTQLNAGYFGIENATLCHCLHRLPSRLLALDAKLCNSYCHARSPVRCGGEYLISIYETGAGDWQAHQTEELRDTELKDAKLKDEALNEQKNEIRIAFILSVNGRSTRQIKRLIRLLYHRKHIYFVHVDRQNDFLFNSLTAELAGPPNVMVTDQRFATIWGGSALLEMLLNSFRILSAYEWDVVINLSESDFLIKPLSSLERYLKRFEGKNFLKFHGQTNDAFVRKQGIEVLFVQCENRMWRLNKQRELPGVVLSGGSDWIALHRSFVRWLIGDQLVSSRAERNFVASLRTFFNYTLLPAESFFHTALVNSKFCDTVINSNLRLTNWKRRIGCKCQYQHIVDWCGCSPNVYLEQDWPRLQSTHDKPLFFARKFDPLIDQQIINQVESSIDPSIESSFDSYRRYWQNEFHFEHDRQQLGDRLLWQSMFGLLSTIALKDLLLSNCPSNYASSRRASYYLDAIELSSVHTLIDQGKYAGSVAQVSLNRSRLPDRFGKAVLKLDFLVLPNQAYFKPYNDIESGAFELVSLKVIIVYFLSCFVDYFHPLIACLVRL